MSVFQPLYFGGGQYTPDLDRKLISSLVGVDYLGNRLFGVIPEDITNASMKASISGGTLSVTTGMCVVSEDSTENSTSGGYIAGIFGTAETYTPATNSTGSTVTDLLYAVVDPTQFTITAKQQTASTTVRMTTSATHGFVTGRTVFITGMGALYDGAYTIASTPSTTQFTYTTSSSITTDGSAVTISAAAYIGTTPKIITAKALESGVARLTSASHGLSNNDTVTIVGVDSTFDGTYKIQNVQTNTFDYVVNKAVDNVASYASPTSVTVSSIARASTPFYLAAERGSGTTLSSKSKILLAQYSVATGGSTPSSLADKRKFTSSLGGTVLYTTAGGVPTATQGRIAFNTTQSILQYTVGSTWNVPIELATSVQDTSSARASRGDHVHDGSGGLQALSLTSHTHAAYKTLPHGEANPSGSGEHTLSQITDYVQGTNQEPVYFTPISDGDSSNTLTVVGTSTSSSFSPIIEVAVNTTTDCYVLVLFSAKIDSISAPTGGNIVTEIAPRLQSSSGASGTVIVSDSAVAGSASHQMGATDGTAWSLNSAPWAGRDTNNNYNGQYPNLNGARIFNLSAGTKYFHLRFSVNSGAAAPATVVFSQPTIKVIPLNAL